MNKSKWGYKKGSPYANEPYIDIQGNDITMVGVPHDILALPDNDKPIIMKPGKNYKFPNSKTVREIPLYQKGGKIDISQVKGFDKEKLKAVQLDLQSKGLYKGKIDGIYGKLTEAAINKYNQKQPIDSKYKLTVTDKSGSNVTAPGEKEIYFNPPHLDIETGDENIDFVYKYADWLDVPIVRSYIQKQLEKEMVASGGAPVKMKSDIPIEEKFNGAYSENAPYNLVKQYVYGNQNIPKSKYQPKSDYLSFLPTYSLKNSERDYGNVLEKFYTQTNIKNKMSFGDLKNKVKNKETVYGEAEKSGLLPYDLAHNKMGVGYDEELDMPYVSVSDAWDFEPTHYAKNWTEKNSKNDDKYKRAYQQSYLVHKFGKPFKVYDRFYFNPETGEYINDDSMKKQENKQYQHGGNFGLAGENTMPMSPFISLKPFINKYKLKYGGVIDYMSNLPEEQQYRFAEEFDTLDKDTQAEVEQYLKGGYYQSGGVNQYQTGGIPNAELEDDETLITPDGQLSKIEGKKHSEGGEEVNLPNGTRIYSAFLKAPQEVIKQVLGKETKKKMSYADLSKKFPTKPFIDILDDPKSDDYQKTTAQLKLANNLGKLDTLFFAQEKEKEIKDNDTFQYGGIKKYQMAGQTGNTLEDYILGKVQPLDYQQLSDYPYDYPKVHSEPAATVSTGVVLNLRNDKPIPEYTLPEVEIVGSKPIRENRSKQPITKRKSISSKSNAPVTPVESTESDLWQVPLPLEQLPQRVVPVSSINTTNTPEQIVDRTADIIIGEDDKSYPGKETKREWKFGISPELAGTVADIGLALSDKLRIKEPILYNRQKTPLFTRFVDFDDKEVQRMYDKNIQQIQQSRMPESVKQAQINELTSKYQDYQAKVDFANLQRYETKRERDTDKLQKYTDYNIDQRVTDFDSYRQRKARVDELRDAFYAQRKSRIVNSLKAYAEYADQISKANEFTPNYRINPITGRIDYRPQERTQLTENLLSQYQKRNQNKIDLGQGSTGQIIGNVLVITDKEGRVTTTKIDQE